MAIAQLEELQDNLTISFHIKEIISEIIRKEFNHETDLSSIEVNPTQDEKFGDYTTNISLKLSKELGKNPREIAQVIIDSNAIKTSFVEKVEIAGPGFINITLNKAYYLETLNYILENGDAYGKWELDNKQIMMEFGQPNTHKAFHVGHLKSAITGLSIARLIRNLGYEVIQANYFGDVGMHVAKCVWGYLKKSEDSRFKDQIENEADPHRRMRMLDECYVFGAAEFKENPEAENEMREINKKIYDKSDENITLAYLKTREWSIEHQTDVFKKLGVIYDRQYPESEIANDSLEIIKSNIGKVFKEDEGAIIFPGKDYGLNNWVFITKDGNPSYSGKDMGLAYKKFKEYPDLYLCLIETSVEQNDYFKGWIKALELIDNKFEGKTHHIGHGWLLRQDKKKFSSRMGNTVKGMDILAEAIELSASKISEGKSYTEEEAKLISEKVAIAGLKFLILSHEVHKDISYDTEQFLNPEGFSGPYVLYAYVRAQSILRQVGGTWNVDSGSHTLLTTNHQLLSDIELKLLKLLSKFHSVTLDAGRTISPHKICNYIFDVAQTFNQFYRENKVLVENEDVKHLRLSLTRAVSIVLKNGLDLLGIDVIDQM